MNTFILDFENYNLSEDEILSITEANTHLLQKHYLYALHELFAAYYINILRRIEFFGISLVLEDINKNNLFEAIEVDILKRWKKFDEIDIIKSLRHLKIINNQTYSLFFSFYNTKSSISRNDEISEEYLFSFFNLLKVELLEHKFVKYDKDKHKFERRKNRVIEKRRKEDLKENDDLKEETKTEDISMIHPVHLIIKEKLTAKELYNIKDKKEDEDNDEIEAIYI